MKKTYFLCVSLVVFLSIAISVSAQTWGVSVSDPAIDKMRDQFAQQIGINDIVAARFSAAVNRLVVLEQRIDSRIEKTSTQCTSKLSLANQLSNASATISDLRMISILDTSAIAVDATTKTEAPQSADAVGTGLVVQSNVVQIDTQMLELGQQKLQSALSDLSNVVDKLAQCPENQSALNQSASSTVSDTSKAQQDPQSLLNLLR